MSETVQPEEVGYSKPPVRGRFQKGVSGNPGGRKPVDKDAKALAKANTLVAMKKLVELLDDDDSRVVLAAAREILDRGLGKAPAAPEDADKSGLTIQIVQAPPRVETKPVEAKIIEHERPRHHAPEQMGAPTVSIRPLGLSS